MKDRRRLPTLYAAVRLLPSVSGPDIKLGHRTTAIARDTPFH